MPGPEVDRGRAGGDDVPRDAPGAPRGRRPAPAAPYDPAPRPAGGGDRDGDGEDDTLADRLARIEALLAPTRTGLAQAGQRFVPAWRRVTRGEVRWASSSAVLAVVVIQLTLPRLALGAAAGR